MERTAGGEGSGLVPAGAHDGDRAAGPAPPSAPHSDMIVHYQPLTHPTRGHLHYAPTTRYCHHWSLDGEIRAPPSVTVSGELCVVIHRNSPSGLHHRGENITLHLATDTAM